MMPQKSNFTFKPGLKHVKAFFVIFYIKFTNLSQIDKALTEINKLN